MWITCEWPVIRPGAVDGWHFVNRGALLPFEDIGHYARRAITVRLNFKILGGMPSNL